MHRSSISDLRSQFTMADGIKRWAKRVVNAPEQPVPTVTAKEWVRQYTDQSPKEFVRISLGYDRRSHCLGTGHQLRQVAVPLLPMVPKL
jgi:hypothetical protein